MGPVYFKWKCGSPPLLRSMRRRPTTAEGDRCCEKSVTFDRNICHQLNGIKKLSHTHALPLNLCALNVLRPFPVNAYERGCAGDDLELDRPASPPEQLV